jgi:hypothetical protein
MTKLKIAMVIGVAGLTALAYKLYRPCRCKETLNVYIGLTCAPAKMDIKSIWEVYDIPNLLQKVKLLFYTVDSVDSNDTIKLEYKVALATYNLTTFEEIIKFADRKLLQLILDVMTEIYEQNINPRWPDRSIVKQKIDELGKLLNPKRLKITNLYLNTGGNFAHPNFDGEHNECLGDDELDAAITAMGNLEKS